MSTIPTATEVERFRKLVLQAAGLDFADERLLLLGQVLAARVRASGRTVREYLEIVSAPARLREELRILAPELTITETSFFRNADQIDAFVDVALAERARARADCGQLRILSAGCASGEEAYTLAACVRDNPALARWDVSILGIDINRRALRKAAAARFSSWSLRQTPAAVRSRLFRENAEGFLLDDAIRDRVRFEERNLAADDPDFWREGAFDIIFCRNVLMYFAPDAAREAVARMAHALAPGGYLFLGHAETLRGVSTDFDLCQSHDTFYYRRRGAKPRARAVRARASAPVSPPPIVADRSWFDEIHSAARRIELITAAARRTRARVPRQREPTGAAALRDAAADLLGSERFAEAEQLLNSLPAEAVGDPGVLLLKAVLQTHGGDLLAAERTCADLLRIDPGCAGAHYLLALCRESARDDHGAVHHNRAAARLDPGFAMPRLRLGLLSRRAGNRRAARENLAQALALLERGEGSRVDLFGGGFSRRALIRLCRAEIAACGDAA